MKKSSKRRNPNKPREWTPQDEWEEQRRARRVRRDVQCRRESYADVMKMAMKAGLTNDIETHLALVATAKLLALSEIDREQRELN